MTEPTTSYSEPRQLTIDGGSVPHPPPRPRVTCPECRKMITLTDRGEYRHHNIYEGNVCPMAGQRYGR
jgi:hypothetical protein